MIRYLNSFLITSLLYALFIGGFLYVYANQEIIIPKKIEKKRISLKHIELVKKEEPKPKILEKKIVDAPVKKEIPIEKPKEIEIPKLVEIPKKIEKAIVKKEIKPPKRKIVKKKVKKKVLKKKIVKKVAKKKVKKKKKIKKENRKKIVKKEIPKKKEVKKKILKTEVKEIKKSVQTTMPSQMANYKQSFIKNNLIKIKKQIQKSVKYSKRARKMGVQGIVLVQFVLAKNGSIKDIKALKGHKLLRKSTIKAIHKASKLFPNVHKDITIKVPIEYKLI